MYTSLELCAGAGGQALGLHLAGFHHVGLVEYEKAACETLNLNNEKHSLGWARAEPTDLTEYHAHHLRGQVDLVAGGVPCPPFSKAGKQLGKDDERDMFPHALRIVEQVRPKAVMFENVSGLLDARFQEYRSEINQKLSDLGFQAEWRLLNASDYGVPQLRPRVIMVALRKDLFAHFSWPEPSLNPAPTVGEALYDLMASAGWSGARRWKEKANRIAPTLVGGSKKHGGPDLGPTRAKRAWKELHVNGHRVGDEPPGPDYSGVREGYEDMPLITVRMAARIQGFPDWWEFSGRKTAAYRQVGNAFPPPVAQAVAGQILAALNSSNAANEAVQYSLLTESDVCFA
ncbi:DNA cytosine methyltransferase [Marinobacter daepoensis]|uniref:DNA cytosine methyltransferase n=1 Tax=Marinobacter daepoensis TaxID=262077 RepID=UPI001C977FCA|nr:DNA cytosine methyltransferase [Marinobacter daepoensis]MBY6034991.1 DNA cytosine methyltransferase [Marinobacter daepoensis]